MTREEVRFIPDPDALGLVEVPTKDQPSQDPAEAIADIERQRREAEGGH